MWNRKSGEKSIKNTFHKTISQKLIRVEKFVEIGSCKFGSFSFRREKESRRKEKKKKWNMWTLKICELKRSEEWYFVPSRNLWISYSQLRRCSKAVFLLCLNFYFASDVCDYRFVDVNRKSDCGRDFVVGSTILCVHVIFWLPSLYDDIVPSVGSIWSHKWRVCACVLVWLCVCERAVI